MLKTLLEIQQTFRAVKDQRNEFGGFNYRNVEVMLTELKPILAEHEACITFSDEIIERGGRCYIEATATLRTPKLLLLDEHTAALDPKTAAKVLELTEKLVADQHLTALMVTHNMKDAIAMGNRLIMMHAGQIVVDVSGERKKALTMHQLMELFEKAAGEELSNDRMLLS